MRKILSLIIAICLCAMDVNYSNMIFNNQQIYANAETSLSDFKFDIDTGVLRTYTGTENCLEIPSDIYGMKLKIIGNGVFEWNYSLKSVTIPYNIERIGYLAFGWCRNLSEINLSNSVVSIGDGAFYKCRYIKDITIPDSVEKIGYVAFANCTSLNSITVLNPKCQFGDDSYVVSNGYDENNEPFFDGIIYGYDNSTAQAYAEKYNCKFESLGQAPDINAYLPETKEDTIQQRPYIYRPSEGRRQFNDAEFDKWLKECEEFKEMEEQEQGIIKFGDINLDSTIDAVDASTLLTYYALSSTAFTGSLKNYLECSYYDDSLIEKASEKYIVFGDINGDEIVDAVDASTILSYYAYSSTKENILLEEYIELFGT